MAGKVPYTHIQKHPATIKYIKLPSNNNNSNNYYSNIARTHTYTLVKITNKAKNFAFKFGENNVNKLKVSLFLNENY